MNTLKSIRIATGVKKIELNSENFAMLLIREVLQEHRDTLINSLLADLNTYLGYKFSMPVTLEQSERIRVKLGELRSSSLSLARYSEVVQEILERETTYVKSEAFYHEINEVIGEELNPAQLVLVR